MKLLIIFAIACSVLAKKFDTDNNLAIDLAAKLQHCNLGTHLDNNTCVKNTEYCDNYDKSTKNCIDCNWYTFWTDYADRPWQGSYCTIHWWLFALWMLGLVLLLILFVCCQCKLTKAPKKKTKPKENFKNSQKNQEVVVQREPKVIHQKRPEYSSYREPVEVTRYENPNPRYELPKEQFDKYEYEEPRANSNQVYVIEEPIQVNHGQSRFVEERMSYNPNRDSRVIEGSNMQYSDSYAGYNPYNLY